MLKVWFPVYLENRLNPHIVFNTISTSLLYKRFCWVLENVAKFSKGDTAGVGLDTK